MKCISKNRTENTVLKKLFVLILSALLLISCTNAAPQLEGVSLAPSTPSVSEPADGETPSAPSDPGAAAGEAVDFASLTADEVKAWAEAEPFDFSSVNAADYVRLGQVEGLQVTKNSAAVTDEEFENELDALLDSYSYALEITDRPVAEGDVVRADYAGYKDGEAFAGGTASNQRITAQGGTGYIEGFAEAFIGQNPGEEFSFNVTFPENYGVEELNGQEVTFVATVHAIVTDEEIVPELDEEFVSSNFSYDSVEEFRDAYRLTVEKRKAYYVNNAVYNDLWEKVLEGAEVVAWPESEVRRIYAEHRIAYENYASYYETDYENFLKTYMNQTDEGLYAMAQSYVKEDLVMNALSDSLGVHPTDEQHEQILNELAEYNGATPDELTAYYGEETLDKSVLWQLIMEAVASTAVVTEN